MQHAFSRKFKLEDTWGVVGLLCPCRSIIVVVINAISNNKQNCLSARSRPAVDFVCNMLCSVFIVYAWIS